MAQLSVILRELTHLQGLDDIPVDANMDLVNTLRVLSSLCVCVCVLCVCVCVCVCVCARICIDDFFAISDQADRA